jgi:hypothetical protein
MSRQTLPPAAFDTNRVRICAPTKSKKGCDEDNEHKTHSLCRYDVPLCVFMKASYALDGHIIRLCGTRRENYVLRISTNKVGNVLEIFMRRCGEQTINNKPSSHPPLPSPPPTRMRVFGCADFRTGQSSRGAWHPRHAGL